MQRGVQAVNVSRTSYLIITDIISASGKPEAWHPRRDVPIYHGPSRPCLLVLFQRRWLGWLENAQYIQEKNEFVYCLNRHLSGTPPCNLVFVAPQLSLSSQRYAASSWFLTRCAQSLQNQMLPIETNTCISYSTTVRLACRVPDRLNKYIVCHKSSGNGY